MTVLNVRGDAFWYNTPPTPRHSAPSTGAPALLAPRGPGPFRGNGRRGGVSALNPDVDVDVDVAPPTRTTRTTHAMP
jgi:hypothetical protein